jgi:hypothetical protein
MASDLLVVAPYSYTPIALRDWQRSLVANDSVFTNSAEETFSLIGEYRFHPADHSANQTHLDAVRVISRIGENFLNRPFGEFPGSLILFLNHLNLRSRFDIRSFSTIRH